MISLLKEFMICALELFSTLSTVKSNKKGKDFGRNIVFEFDKLFNQITEGFFKLVLFLQAD